MKEKRLITIFFLGNMIDASSTAYLLAQDGWQELNVFANGKIVQGEFTELIILKLAVTAVLIGSYALAKSTGSRLKFPLEKSLSIGTYAIWGVLAWNALNVIATMALTST